ncbi:MurR/RpiR family transcriptional regulator [Paenibacillus chartarius]|uniref:MurR/RpiR family transcriptional regulator n=1 Tax=Paenibacillus chartarius TaxID=747481 RepID=A0ABV6DL71_9BACL
MSSILVAIESSMSELHPKEQLLAGYIAAHPLETTRLSIVELAERSGTSTATVSRFCKSFHFESFSDFKIKLSAELALARSGAASYQDIVAGTSTIELLTAVKDNHTRSISETASLLDPSVIERAIAVLQKARHIDIYGVATSGVAASDFYQKLVRIGRRASMFTDSHMQITSAATLTEDDVVLAVSYSGETPEIVDAVRCAKRQGATVVSLTKYGPNTLAASSDIQLFTSALEEGIRRGDMASRIAQLFVLDVLFTGMLSTAFDKYIPKLEESYQRVREYRKPSKER